jgi:glycosyltransferase involved in cell wall biosynthesis
VRVHVWAPATAGVEPSKPGVEVHRLPGCFGPQALATLGRQLDAADATRIVVQYVPQGYGMRGMNLLFCLWLLRRRRLDITVMFHEVAVALSRRQPIAHNVIGLVNRAMALVMTRAARRSFVGAAAWERQLRPLAPPGHPITWLPVPSNVPVADDLEGVRAVRRTLAREGGIVVGHFGTARQAWIVERVQSSVLPLLRECPSATLLLLGSDSLIQRERVLATAPELRSQVHATGPLAPAELSLHLGACDMMVQPYDDGVSTRRTSMMAALAHRRAVATTAGDLTEPLWAQSGAVALAPASDPAALREVVACVMDDAGERARLGAAAGALYAERFDLAHTLSALTEAERV